MSPLEGRTNFQMVSYFVWDEWRGARENPGTNGGCMSWWEGHFLVCLTILVFLEDDELHPAIDEVVGGEEDAPSDRVLARAGKGVGR